MKYFVTPISKEVAFGVSVFPKDAQYIPRWWADGTAALNITFWKEHSSGGHFASIEKPQQLMEDIRAFTSVSRIGEKTKGRA